MKSLIIILAFPASVIADEPGLLRQQELQNMLNHDCGSCHGLTMKGGLGSSLLPDALIDKTDAFLVDTILNGRKDTAMPPWQAFLTAQDALWMVKQLRN